ncbi:bifunctional metallophosphatase/5'-nucleotidase [Shouchella patagoniensis]|uniref:bifunctional metallophosphatase/5'-nucleotidase n=1 Tax=Shouchella patagoniensis TaxID=228576 RepID=UPI000994C199|nr:bifunctional UDP-sugar hydrolase/5'-nucleotidase [Shouchella patagoniensis]
MVNTIKITIFHTNDIHSGFVNWAKIVSHIKKERDTNTRYVDLGDHADRANPMTEATVGQGNIQLLNEAGVDFAAIGNNEGVTFSKEMLHSMYSQANFKLLAANLIDLDVGERPEWALPYWIDEMENGLKVAYIGYTAAMVHFYEQLGWDVSFSLDKLKDIVKAVSKKTDAIILLSHLGLPKDELIAESVSEIDVIIGAHTHNVLQGGKRINGTLICQAGKHGQYLGKLSLTFKGRALRYKEEELLDPNHFVEDPNTKVLLLNLENQANIALQKSAVYLKTTLPVKWFEQSIGPQALCDELTNWCGLDIGMMNAGVLLETLEKGPISFGDIHRVCPHPINPCIVELTGAELIETIERAQTDDIVQLALKGFGFRGKVLGTMIYTGIEINVNGIDVLGEPVKTDKTYKLATLDMYTFGFLFPKIAASSNKDYLLPEFLRDILLSMLKKRN